MFEFDALPVHPLLVQRNETVKIRSLGQKGTQIQEDTTEDIFAKVERSSNDGHDDHHHHVLVGLCFLFPFFLFS